MTLKICPNCHKGCLVANEYCPSCKTQFPDFNTNSSKANNTNPSKFAILKEENGDDWHAKHIPIGLSPKKEFKMRRYFYYIFLFLIIIIIAGFVGLLPGQNESNSQTLNDVELSSNISYFKIGQKSSDGTLDFTLNSIQFPSYGIKGLTSARNGYQYLIANVTITNIGHAKTVNFKSLFQVFIIDDKNSIYRIDQFRSGYIEKGWHDEDVEPGKSIKGLMVFEVPIDFNSLKLRFHFYPSDFSKVAIYEFTNG